MYVCNCNGIREREVRAAIEALARKIVRLHALTDYASGITTNVGVIKGGNTHNTVAPWAEAELDLRFTTLEQRAQIMPEIEKIVSAEDVPGTTAEIAQKALFLPLEEKFF